MNITGKNEVESMDERKIALVTGANKGLGFETSRQLAQQDILVLMGSRSATRGRTAVRKLRDEGLPVEFIQLDVTKPEQIRKAAAEIKKRFSKLDVLVNNAGIGEPDEQRSANSTATISPRALRKTFDTNFFGLVELTQNLLPLIEISPGGRIVNVSSILGSLTIHSKERELDSYKPFAYDTSKTAVNSFTIHLAAALSGTNIKVNSAHPGWVRTDMGGPRAPLSPADGAQTTVRLATLGPNGPTGKFFHGEEQLPW
jgi:NAD(P)-dependent dehydrogenase (short-subunit alcohol dehydrogenase family)